MILPLVKPCWQFYEEHCCYSCCRRCYCCHGAVHQIGAAAKFRYEAAAAAHLRMILTVSVKHAWQMMQGTSQLLLLLLLLLHCNSCCCLDMLLTCA
jgi:hypothetical protein